MSRKQNSALIIKSIILLLSFVVIIFVASLSWFSNTTKATADGMNIISKVPDGLEIAVVSVGETPEDDDFTEGTITLNSQNCDFLKDFTFTEITGSGNIGEFYKPLLTQSNGIATPDVEADWDQAVPNTHYLSFDVYFRSKQQFDVFMSSDTSIKPNTSVLTWNSSDSDISEYNPSSFGDFSRDCIVGALRLSAIDSSSEMKLLWIPAPNIVLNTANEVFTVTTNATSGDSYKHYYYKVGDTKEKDEVDSVVANSSEFYTVGKDVLVSQLTNIQDGSEYYVDHFTCNLWVEGEDTESRLALTGGEFTFNLRFGVN